MDARYAFSEAQRHVEAAAKELQKARNSTSASMDLQVAQAHAALAAAYGTIATASAAIWPEDI